MVLADGLLVVGTAEGLVALDAFSGEQRWAVEDTEGAPGARPRPRRANLAYWSDNGAVMVDLRDGAVLDDLGRPGDDRAPHLERAPHFDATVNGFRITSAPGHCRVVSPLGATWLVRVAEPFHAEGMVVTEGTWAWFSLPDGRLYGVDFGSAGIESELDEIAQDPPVTRAEHIWGQSQARGLLALVGSGEYLPEMAPIEARLLAGRPARYVQVATAAVPDGPAVVSRWHRLGAEQARRLGAEAVALPVNDRVDADDPGLAAQVSGAGLVYLSGGDPAYLATTLRGTAVWAAIVEAWKAGASLAGCSAGAMALAALVPSVKGRGQAPVPGLGLLPQLRVVPHFDRLAAGKGPSLDRFLLAHDDGVVVVGLDEQTALIGGPEHWSVQGRGSAWALSGGESQPLPAGSTLVTPLPA